MFSSTAGGIFGGVAIFAIIAACWRYIVMFFNFIRGIIFVQADLSEFIPIRDGVVSLIRNDLKYIELTPDRYFSVCWHYIKKEKDFKCLAVENLFSRSYLAFYKGRPFIFKPGKEYNRHDSQGQQQGVAAGGKSHHSRIFYIRGFFDLESLIQECMTQYNLKRSYSDETNKRYEVVKYFGKGSVHARSSNDSGGEPAHSTRNGKSGFRNDTAIKQEVFIGGKRLMGYDLKDLEKGVLSDKPFDVYAYPDYVMELVEEARKWKESKDWYCERDMDWRRGWMLHGCQGTGKTTLIKSLAQELDMPVILFDLSSMSNSEFNTYWNEAKSYSPCFAVFEDFDSVFSKRKNILGDAGGGLSFDTVLQCISGVDESNGIFLFVTTNKIDEIDDALGKPVDMMSDVSMSTRPGRIDKTIRFGIMGEGEKRTVAEKILVDIKGISIDEVLSETDGWTAAQFKEKCCAIALENYWNNTIGELNARKETEHDGRSLDKKAG